MDRHYNGQNKIKRTNNDPHNTTKNIKQHQHHWKTGMTERTEEWGTSFQMDRESGRVQRAGIFKRHVWIVGVMWSCCQKWVMGKPLVYDFDNMLGEKFTEVTREKRSFGSIPVYPLGWMNMCCFHANNSAYSTCLSTKRWQKQNFASCSKWWMQLYPVSMPLRRIMLQYFFFFFGYSSFHHLVYLGTCGCRQKPYTCIYN